MVYLLSIQAASLNFFGLYSHTHADIHRVGNSESLAIIAAVHLFALSEPDRRAPRSAESCIRAKTQDSRLEAPGACPRVWPAVLRSRKQIERQIEPPASSTRADRTETEKRRRKEERQPIRKLSFILTVIHSSRSLWCLYHCLAPL